MAKTALITGGSSGLGFSFATLLGKEGYHIIILARNEQRIKKAAEALAEKNISARGIACDVTQEGQLREAAAIVRSEFGQIDFLVLNAGEVTTKLLKDYSSATELKKDLEIDLWGTIQSAYFFVPLLPSGSKVLMTSSGFGLMGAAGYSIYCAAKAGIINFGESLRRELLHKNISVYVTCPGDMDTPQFHAEIEGQPGWMKEKSSPRKMMPAEISAKRILRQCRGHTKFLIIPSPDVRLLIVVSKLLPRKWRDRMIDSMFPRPVKKE
ncbi:MAG: SDR family NAD(P)-dependent oxidoreductase [Bacteroidetes bacterium]|nr:SDR family NAD(P)-dependent oxidoreductase [Bacteroidota bacterium]